jgi:hypothetical protein
MVMSSVSDELNLCTRCIGDKRFAQWIEDHGAIGRCNFDPSHGDAQQIASVATFAEEVDRYFREHYLLGEEYPYATIDSDSPSYAQLGEPYKDILSNELECDETIIDAVADKLPDCSHYDIADGAQPFYDDCANYESIAAVQKREREEEEERWYERRFSYQWEDFCKTVQYERRFFKIKELLDDLFGKPEEYDNGQIRPVYALKIGQRVYRARLLDDDFTEEKLGGNPSRELSAPPREKAPAGRMNVEYIPAFYAAFCEQTAIAELRPGIGDQVAVGEFVLQRELRVFDFTAFARRHGSEWKDCYAHTRYDFITQMEDEISKPVLPFEKQRKYIATQIVAEYLKEYFGSDAVIYRSSMQKDDKIDNRNIVILNRGLEFVGDSTASVVSYTRHDVREVMDVIYKVAAWPF